MSPQNMSGSIKGPQLSLRHVLFFVVVVFSFQNATSIVLLAVLCYYFLLEKEGWAAERSRSEKCCFGMAFERA